MKPTDEEIRAEKEKADRAIARAKQDHQRWLMEIYWPALMEEAEQRIREARAAKARGDI